MKTFVSDQMQSVYSALQTLDFDKIHKEFVASNIEWKSEFGGYSVPSATQIRWVARNLLMLTAYEAVLSKTVCELSSRGFSIIARPAIDPNAAVQLTISFKLQ